MRALYKETVEMTPKITATTTTAPAKTSTTTTVVINDQVRRKMEDVTKGLTYSYFRRLGLCNSKHITVICDYIAALRSYTRVE